jgi:hypothetical protein
MVILLVSACGALTKRLLHSMRNGLKRGILALCTGEGSGRRDWECQVAGRTGAALATREKRIRIKSLMFLDSGLERR